jgi:hypothetical protein
MIGAAIQADPLRNRNKSRLTSSHFGGRYPTGEQ